MAPASIVGAVIVAIFSVSDSAPGRGRDVCRHGSIHESADKRGWECAALGPSEGFGWSSLYRQSTQQTSSCTREVRAFRNGFEGFSKAEVIGISSDSVEWHRNFAERHDLPFTLPSDEGLR